MKMLFFALLIPFSALAQFDRTPWPMRVSTNVLELLTNRAPRSVDDAIYVLGRNRPYDGGGGTFFYDKLSTDATNRGTLFSPSGFSTGRWSRVFSGPLNVLWFGADPSNTVDSSAAIQDAIDTAAQFRSQGVGVYIPHGVYKLNSGLVITHPLVIFGDGLTGDIARVYGNWSGTELRYTGTGTALMVGDGTRQNHRVFLRDIAITSVKRSGERGISVVRTEECEFVNVKIGGVDANGFKIGFYAEAMSITTIEKCNFSGNGTGVKLDWATHGGCSNVKLVNNNNFYWNTNHVAIYGGDSISIQGNWFERAQNNFVIDANGGNGKVQLQGLKIKDNQINNSDAVFLGATNINSRALLVNASTNRQFYVQSFTFSGNQIRLDRAAAYAIEVRARPAAAAFKFAANDWRITGNSFRGPTAATLYSDVDFAPAYLNNESTAPKWFEGNVHARLLLPGQASELIVGEIKLASAAPAKVAVFDSQSRLTSGPVDASTLLANTRVVNSTGSLTGGGPLTGDRTLSLVNDNPSPGPNRYYGTDPSGTKGFFTLPTGTQSNSPNNVATPLNTTNQMFMLLDNPATPATAGPNKAYWRVPYPGTLKEAIALSLVPSSSGTLTLDLKKNGVSILGSPLTLATGVTNASANLNSTALSTGDILSADVISPGTGSQGPAIQILYTVP